MLDWPAKMAIPAHLLGINFLEGHLLRSSLTGADLRAST
jgi:hypothetical protein